MLPYYPLELKPRVRIVSQSPNLFETTTTNRTIKSKPLKTDQHSSVFKLLFF